MSFSEIYQVDAFAERPFTGNPAVEIALCGHATQASAYVLFGVLGAAPREFRLASSGKSICVFETEAQIRALKPDFGLMAGLGFSLIVTAPGTESDFVSRYFAPNLGANEDPVTGAAHCQLIPYWAHRLGKNELFAIQVSARQGKLWCRLEKDEVFISGYAVLFFKGKLERLL